MTDQIAIFYSIGFNQYERFTTLGHWTTHISHLRFNSFPAGLCCLLVLLVCREGDTINCSQYAGGQSEGSYRPSSVVGHKMLSLIVTHTEVNNKAVEKFSDSHVLIADLDPLSGSGTM